MYILGISAFYHDSSATLIKNGEIIAAAQEERFTRIKFDSSYPINCINYCLEEAKIEVHQISEIIYFEKNSLKFDRIIKTYFRFLPKSFFQYYKALNLWFNEKLYIEQSISDHLKWNKKINSFSHHESHAASAFFPSPFNDAAILTLDGVGEWTCTSIGYGKNNQINILYDV